MKISNDIIVLIMLATLIISITGGWISMICNGVMMTMALLLAKNVEASK